jgi:hypothetical protein
MLLVVEALVPSSSFLGHVCGLMVGYACMCTSLLLLARRYTDTVPDGLDYLKFLAPPDRILRWVEGKLNLLGRLPHYVSVDQKTFGRFGVLPGTVPGGRRLGP